MTEQNKITAGCGGLSNNQEEMMKVALYTFLMFCFVRINK